MFEEESGRVGLISPEQKFDLINSCIAQFAHALLEYRSFSDFADENEEEHPKKVRRRLREMERSLQQDGPEAFSSGEYYWPVWTDEIDVGLS